MYIRDFRIRNYAIHQNTSIQLLPLTVFVGPNGGGKSAFFDAMLNFSLLSRGNLRAAFGPYPYSFRATLWRGASSVARIGYKASMSQNATDSTWLEYQIDYAQSGMDDDEPKFTVFVERLTKQPANQVLFDRQEPEAYSLSKNLELDNDRSIFSALRQKMISGGQIAIDSLASYCTQQISRFNKFRLDPYVLAQPSRFPEVTKRQPRPCRVLATTERTLPRPSIT